MRRFLFVSIFFVSLPALAQFTTVSGTVTDPNGLPYAGGTITAVLTSSGSPTLGGLPYTPPTQPTGLSSAGSFVMQLADNGVLLPAASKWQFTVCSGAATVQPAIGKGPVCFSLAAPITVTGASQDISAPLTAAALPLTVPVGGGGGTPGGVDTNLQVKNGTGFAAIANVVPGSWLASQGVSTLPVFQTKTTIDVRDYGVKCDGTTNDTTAMNAAFAAAVAVGTTTGKTADVALPSGTCLGNFYIEQGKGLRIHGAGTLTTVLLGAGSSPALQINGLWYSSFSDLSFKIQTHSATNGVLEIDGDYDGTHFQKVQFLTFNNILVSGIGTSDGLRSIYATAVCRQSSGNCQGSSLTFINPAMSGASSAAYLQSGFNALGNQIIGGDFQNYTTDGVEILNGSIFIYGATFETANGCAQLLNAGWDVHTLGGSFPIQVISGVRSEGWTMFRALGGSIDAVSQSPAWVSYLSNHAFSINTPVEQTGTDGLHHLYCMTTAGTTGGSPPTWPATGTVSDGTAVWTEETYNAVDTPAWFNSNDSHLDETASLNYAGWNNTLGAYSLTSTGLIGIGTFDSSTVSGAGVVEHAIEDQNASTILDLYANSQGTPKTSLFQVVSTIPASSVGILTRGGVERLYLGDNLYEGTDGGQAARAGYHLSVTDQSLYAASTPATNLCSGSLTPLFSTGAQACKTIGSIFNMPTQSGSAPSGNNSSVVGSSSDVANGGSNYNLTGVWGIGEIDNNSTPQWLVGVTGLGKSAAATGTIPNVAGLQGYGVVSGSQTATTLMGVYGQVRNETSATTEPFGAAFYADSPVTTSPFTNVYGYYEAGTAPNLLGGSLTVPSYNTTTNCAANGTAANPSVVTCSAAAAGAFSCDVAASAATCTLNTSAITVNSEIFVQEVSSEGARLGVTCNTGPTAVAAILVATKGAGTATINMPTITVNPACFVYEVIN